MSLCTIPEKRARSEIDAAASKTGPGVERPGTRAASGPGAMPRGWRLSYYSRIAEASGSAPAPDHAGGVSFTCRPGAPDRADLVRNMNQFAKKHFLRDAAFLFSH